MLILSGILIVIGYAPISIATPYAISVVDYSTNAEPPCNNPLEALGPPDATDEETPAPAGTYSVGNSGWIILELGQPVFNVEGADIIVWEEKTHLNPTSLPDEGALVYLSTNVNSWTQVGRVERGNRESMFIDIDSTGTSGSTYIKIVDDGGVYSHNGFELDAITIISEPSTPPVADADGPYSIYVGDTLTLDASGSTDADGDIVSYIWDLDDDENFETDAGDQAILVLDYSYLQSLGLLIKHTYTIHLKVTDSKDQSDIADSTLTIVPKPALAVAVDIKPGSCPNPLNVKSKGVLPVAILGTDDYDITTIDPTSIRLTGVEPLRSGYEDVATPVTDANDCNCTEEGPDGFLDLTLKFKTQRIVEAIGDVNDGDVRVLELTGVLYDPPPYETPIEGADCVLIRGKHKPINPADINKDGVVDVADFAIFAQNWLQSSIVNE